MSKEIDGIISTEIDVSHVADLTSAPTAGFISEDGTLIGSLEIPQDADMTVVLPYLTKGKYRLTVNMDSLSKAKQGTQKKDETKKWVSITPRFDLIDEAGIQQLLAKGWVQPDDGGRFSISWKDSFFLDMKDNGQLDFDRGKNIALKQFMAITGADKRLERGYPGCFEALIVMGTVVVVPYESDKAIANPALRRMRNVVEAAAVIR